MKSLIIVRHAKSSWENPELDDFDRPLNERGLRDAPRMAKRLKEKDFTIHAMVTSSARRALATCEIFAEVLAFPRERIEFTRSLYHAGSDTLLTLLRKRKDQPVAHEVVVIFGHNPGLTEFVNQLTEEDIDNIPTTGVVHCHLSIERWADIVWGCAKLEFFDRPKSIND